MKHRIIKRGDKYYVQEKLLWGWCTVQGLGEADIPFDTIKQAERAIDTLEKEEKTEIIKEYGKGTKTK